MARTVLVFRGEVATTPAREGAHARGKLLPYIQKVRRTFRSLPLCAGVEGPDVILPSLGNLTANETFRV